MGARFRSADLSGGANASDDDDEHHDFEIPAGCNMGRRRSRAVLYQLSGHYKPEKTKPKLKLNNVSNKGLKNNFLLYVTYKKVMHKW